MVEQLLKLGARTELVDINGDTAKDIAEKYGEDDIYYTLP
jgi:hypothetical protein